MIYALLLAAALTVAPQVPGICDGTDTDCLKQWILFEHNRAEAAQENLDDTQKQLADTQQDLQKEKAHDSGAKFFICGMVIGTIFFGLMFTAQKKISEL